VDRRRCQTKLEIYGKRALPWRVEEKPIQGAHDVAKVAGRPERIDRRFGRRSSGGEGVLLPREEFMTQRNADSCRGVMRHRRGTVD